MTYARSLWTKNRLDEAQKIFLDLLKLPEISEHHEAKVLSMLTKMCVEKKDFDGAQKYLEQISSKKNVGADLLKEVFWLKSWQHYLNKQYIEAEAGFKICVNKSDDKTLSARCKFWQAKALTALAKPDEASALYREVTESLPYDYYGIISQRELKKPFVPVAKFTYDENDQFDPQLEWLYIFGEFELARNYLDQEVLKRKSSELKDLADDYLPYFVRFKYYQGLLKYLSQIGASFDIKLTEKYFSFLYPLAYLSEIQNYSSDPALPLSIMRQESVFNAYARSPADAFGLMQIIPETAKAYAKNAKINLNNFEELYLPEINIPIGVAILEGNIRKFGKFMPAYVASYNADGGAVKNWLAQRYNGDSLAFIENIPYSETQNYVKLVLRNYINYQRLLSKNEFLFPEELFSEPIL
jgi:soluble lytic murein transglycosylase